MQSAIARLALALALLQPALRAQVSFRGLTRYITTIKNGQLVGIYRDNSNNCWEIKYRVFLTPTGETLQATSVELKVDFYCGDVTVSPNAVFPEQDDLRQHLMSSLTRTEASTTPRALIWIGSDTPPSTAPNAAGAVYVVDPSTSDTVAAIALSGSPSALATNHAGTYMYAVTSPVPGPGPSVIEAMNTSSYTVTQTINLPQGVSPGTPALSADDRYLYVPNNASAGGVLVIDTQNPSSITTIPTTVTYPKSTQPAPVAQAAVSPDGELVFAWGSYNIFVIDTTVGQQIGQILLPAEQGNQFLQNQQQTGANYFVIDPTGSRIYAFANYGSGPSDTWTGYLHAYDTASLSLVSSIELGQGVDLDNIAFSPETSTVLVSSFVYTDGQNATFIIDAQSLAVTHANPTAPSVSLGDGVWQTMLVVLQ
jgi:hypothetical protein